ncbi:MAG: hypothetical protein U1F68_19875 [Gammaproteobacteria bacterium]
MTSIRMHSILSALIVGCLLTVSLNSASAEKKKFIYTKIARQTIAETKIYPGNDREMIEGVYADTLKSSESEWDGIEERVYGHEVILTNGTGKHYGTAVDIFRDGDKLFQNYSGGHKTTGQGDAQETIYEGSAEIVGGTGKYKNAKGTLTYRTKVSKQGIEEVDTVELEY